MNIAFTPDAFVDFQLWAKEDKKIFSKINELIKDICRNPFCGIEKPEPLKHELSGLWSRRITAEHRLVYKIDGSALLIVSCKFHY